MTGPPIQVLLATYNGERFLRRQIESILAQTYAPVAILAADDGSTDGTAAILQEYARHDPMHFLILDDATPTGHPKRNFSRLLQASTAPYVALADQDDLWTVDKLERSIAAMQHAESQSTPGKPILVYTDLELIDEDDTSLAPSLWQHQGIPGMQTSSYAHLLAQNVFTGCTGLLNRPLVGLCTPVPEAAEMHDWWIMLVAATLGMLVPLPVATVRYRQHAANAVGAVKQQRRRLLPNLREHKERRIEWDKTENNARALLDRFPGAIPSAKRKLIEAYLRCGTSPHRLIRVATLLRHGFLRKSLRMNLAMLWYLWDLNATAHQSRGDHP